MNTTEYLEQLVTRLNNAWENRDYELVARIGSTHGVFLMREEIGCIPNDQLGFVPNLFIVKGGRLSTIIETPGLPVEDIQPTIKEVFSKFQPEGVLFIVPASLRREKDEVKIVASVGQVFLAPDNVVGQSIFPVGTREELQAAGCGEVALFVARIRRIENSNPLPEKAADGEKRFVVKKTYVPRSKKVQPVVSYFSNETSDAWEATPHLDKAYPFKNRGDAEELGKRWVADQASKRHFSVEVLEIENAAAA